MENVKLTVQQSCRKDLFLVCRCPNVGEHFTERQMQQEQPRLQSAKRRPALHRCAAPSALGHVSYGSFGGSPRIPLQREDTTALWKMVSCLLEANEASSLGLAPGTSDQRDADLPSAACSTFASTPESAGIF